MKFSPTKRHEITQPQDQSIRLIALTQGLNAIVDAADYEWLNGFNWHANRHKHTHYVLRGLPHNHLQFMHKLILPTEKGFVIDHINKDGLDNRRVNLRIATVSQNLQNSRTRKGTKSGLKGVSWITRDRK